ncbi:MAG: nucleotidyltransferase family protein [Terracidiphilus sp.]|nr:nucleotidyltransferase family protein [Terracidiphilus sp.]
MKAPMKAMVLAAGLGTRLLPLTTDRPKALVEVGGQTMLELTLRRLAHFGIRDVIVNAHHFADLLIDYLKAHDNFGLHIEISREDVLLDTGGGIKRAAEFFLSGSSDEPFLVHNVDVLSNIDLNQLRAAHIEQNALATLAVQQRPTSRYLLFDLEDLLCGRRAGLDGTPEMARPADEAQALAFSGIHILSPRIFPLLTESGTFSIIPAYLRLAAQGERIAAFHADAFRWRDLGKPDSVQRAAEERARGLFA